MANKRPDKTIANSVPKLKALLPQQFYSDHIVWIFLYLSISPFKYYNTVLLSSPNSCRIRRNCLRIPIVPSSHLVNNCKGHKYTNRNYAFLALCFNEL